MVNYFLGGFQESKFLKFLGFMWNPLSWVMEAAAIMAIALANGGVSLFFLAAFWYFSVCICECVLVDYLKLLFVPSYVCL
jgi:hypothetical protein